MKVALNWVAILTNLRTWIGFYQLAQLKGKKIMLYTFFSSFSALSFLPHFCIIRPAWPMYLWPEQKEKLMMFQLCSRLSYCVIYPFIQQTFTKHYVPGIVFSSGNVAKNKCLKVLSEMPFLKVSSKVASLDYPIFSLSLSPPCFIHSFF